MVLRLNGADSLLPGTGRGSEIDIWHAASKRGIAPPLLHVDVAGEYLVSTYIDTSLPQRSLRDEATLDKVFDLLARCHLLEVDAASIDYTSHIEKYWQIIESSDELYSPALGRQRQSMQSIVEEIVNSGTRTGLCHHDPVIANFVGNPDRLYLIDWEYAACGLLVMDYAALGMEWGFDDTLIIERTGLEPELLALAKSLYGYLCELWALSSGA
jgi:aminoglycoside phosphotransferase (APT) family kinase protein